MKLLFTRSQKKGTFSSKVTFALDVRAELTEEETDDVQKYHMADTMLYKKMELADKGSGLLGLASRLAFKAMNIEIKVSDLLNGKHITCKDIGEMLAVEEQIKEAARNFKDMLEAAAKFGGEEVVEL